MGKRETPAQCLTCNGEIYLQVKIQHFGTRPSSGKIILVGKFIGIAQVLMFTGEMGVPEKTHLSTVRTATQKGPGVKLFSTEATVLNTVPLYRHVGRR